MKEESPVALSTSAAAAPQTVVQPLNQMNWETAVALVEKGVRLRRRRWRLHLGAAAVLGVAGAGAFLWTPTGSLLTAMLVAVSSAVSALVVLIPARLVVSLIDRGLVAALCREEGFGVGVIAAAVGMSPTAERCEAALVQAIREKGSLRPPP